MMAMKASRRRSFMAPLCGTEGRWGDRSQRCSTDGDHGEVDPAARAAPSRIVAWCFGSFFSCVEGRENGEHIPFFVREGGEGAGRIKSGMEK